MGQKKLPIGIDNFEKIQKEDFYYIDKTILIKKLLENWSEVSLFTRPRRFGKTLNMDMLKSFFELGTDPQLFEDLAISREEELCERYMGKFPVIFLTLKGVDGLDFDTAYQMLCRLIRSEISRFICRYEGSPLREELEAVGRIVDSGQMGGVMDSLRLLSEVFEKHLKKKTVILIDEYDVPLDKAYQHGYYDRMVSLIRGLFGQALKSNEYLKFAVLTGCLRISRESIFTGLNNMEVLSITDERFAEYFGFTDAEVRQLLSDYDLDGQYEAAKEWYDGYYFGKSHVYCPWDVINYVKQLYLTTDTKPHAYWINSSGNDLVKRFVQLADRTTQKEIERLIAGEAVEKAVRTDLTYNELDKSIDNLWSVLFTTGYLTRQPGGGEGKYRLVIPNREVREVFILQIQEWFKELVTAGDESVKEFCCGLLEGDAEKIQNHITRILGKTISILDTKARDGQKENFYHGLLLGLLRSRADWAVLSNAESGDGFCDIMIEPDDPDMGILIEVKYAADVAALDRKCAEALEQISDRRYKEKLLQEGRTKILACGIAFNRKRCKVRLACL